MPGEKTDDLRSGIEGYDAAWVARAKPWDTEFFSRPVASLFLERADRGALAPHALGEGIREICRAADSAGIELLECHLDLREFPAAALLEGLGFRLVDSRIRFLSHGSRDRIEAPHAGVGSVTSARPEDRDRIIALTHAGFTDNERFVSRFKNPDYFSPEETRRYFEAWIENTAFGEGSYTAVYRVEGRIVGYYIYQARGQEAGLPLVKGILTAVEKAHRGQNAQQRMQAYLYEQLGFDEWIIDNTTQLTNAAVIRNHIGANKHLEEIVLTFYRKRGGVEGRGR